MHEMRGGSCECWRTIVPRRSCPQGRIKCNRNVCRTVVAFRSRLCTTSCPRSTTVLMQNHCLVALSQPKAAKAILDACSPGTLMRVARVCVRARAAVQDYTRRAFDIDAYLSTFFDDPLVFRELQRQLNVLIIGLSAREFLGRVPARVRFWTLPSPGTPRNAWAHFSAAEIIISYHQKRILTGRYRMRCGVVPLCRPTIPRSTVFPAIY